MNDIELDEALESAVEPLSEVAAVEAGRLAMETMPVRLRHGKRPLPRWLRPAVFAGAALVLTAGAGTTAVTMSHWGEVSMPLGNIRNETPIPLDWTSDTGTVDICKAWIEIQDPLPSDPAALDAAVSAHDWAGFGQRIYDESPADPNQAAGERQTDVALDSALKDFVEATFPGIPWMSPGATGRAVVATGFRCDAPAHK
ncbi:MAG: hypothetical protein FWD85_11105 [Microbacteriaceae bacterium]|nr:hypothetical protein [Microbacteriaceae bacterium]